MQLRFLFVLMIFAGSMQVIQPARSVVDQEIRWNWSQIEPINLQDLQFPKKFVWGVATSGHQIDGHCNCQWIPFEQQKNWRGRQVLEQSGAACDHLNRYQEDIQLVKNLGVSSYRFSLEWSKIEPQPGVFDRAVLDHYHAMLDCMAANFIVPVITLHHFTHPQWFEAKGGFEKEKNNKYFVRYAQKMFAEFGAKVPMWCTFNEPAVYAFQGYIHAKFPPAKKSVALAGVVSKNIILAHIDAYKALKAMPHGDTAQIGITHSITMFDPYHRTGGFNVVERWLCSALNHTFYDAMLQFFVSGKFQFKGSKMLGLFLAGNPRMLLIKPTLALLPLKFELHSEVTFDYAEREKKPYCAADVLDFFGVQPYSHALVDVTNLDAEHNPTLRKGDISTDMPYGVYPEIMERAVHAASLIGVSLYITENGIADARDDRRELYIRRYLYALSQVIKKGYDVRGYFYWSLLDNFEWNLGYGKKFGLYAVNFATQERTLRTGGAYYKKVVEHQNAVHANLA